jgi:hypothetical protein
MCWFGGGSAMARILRVTPKRSQDIWRVVDQQHTDWAFACSIHHVPSSRRSY